LEGFLAALTFDFLHFVKMGRPLCFYEKQTVDNGKEQTELQVQICFLYLISSVKVDKN